MTDTPTLYNSRIIKSYVEYLRRYHPDIDIAPLLKHAGIETFQLDDEGHWLTQEQIDRFQEKLVERTGHPDIAHDVGRYSVTSRASGALGEYMLGFISPSTAYAVVEKINARISRATVLHTRSIGADKVEVKATVNPNVCEKPYQCRYRLGTLESLAKLFTKKFANIEHPVCLHQGGDCCLYTIAWEKTRVFTWKRIRNYSFFLGFMLCILSINFLRPAYWDTLVFLYLLTVMGTAFYAEHLEKKDLLVGISNQGNAAERLLDQISRRSNEVMLIQEIGQATSMILEIEKLLQSIMNSLERRLDFDRGMIMLANKEKTRLVYTVGYGYNPQDDDYLNNIQFTLDNPNSKGTAVEAFRKQTAILVNDIPEIEANLSPKSLRFVRTMGTQSFICVPIVFKGESMGVLIVDNVQSKKPLSQTDMNLLMGIAPQIAISINNALSYQIIKENERRFRSLSENAPDIIYTLGFHGEFTYVNPAFEKILGYAPEEICGRYFIDIARDEDIPRFRAIFKKIRDQKQITKEETGILLHKNRTERYFSISGAPNFDLDGQVIGLVGTLKDLTYIKKSELELQRSYEKLQLAMSSTIDAISFIVESRDPYTAGHQRRVAQLAIAIAKELGFSDEQTNLIRMGSLIHDIGKIYIPAEILSKPTPLSHIEFAMVKSHPDVGYNILKRVDFIPAIVNMVHQHHERMDGSGYPLGISGDDILPESRIIAVADTVEAMASHRPYRPALGIPAALEEITKRRGSTFDPVIVDACLALFNEKAFAFNEDESSSDVQA